MLIEIISILQEVLPIISGAIMLIVAFLLAYIILNPMLSGMEKLASLAGFLHIMVFVMLVLVLPSIVVQSIPNQKNTMVLERLNNESEQIEQIIQANDGNSLSYNDYELFVNWKEDYDYIKEHDPESYNGPIYDVEYYLDGRIVVN